ncbi:MULTISPECIES: SIR2 family protein [unclassified Sphingopyxis]|jgi:hypothetical protein|uniref:SIR2 family protein n=1 Tax=unclassified Sphingopyxis TaxID=2614943 RepID=UPI0025DBFC07|nr:MULTISPECIES: SIR2 family protein [unclassified Sphingopyxis]HEV7312808.1 SIR2 family protein [Sphingopyxis sp.]
MSTKSAAENAQEFAQSAISAAPVIILGSGASAAHGIPGMGPLADHLSTAAINPDWNVDEQAEWQKFLVHLKAGIDLESAMQDIRPTVRQTHLIVTMTRDFLLPYDLTVLEELLLDRRALPLSRLFRHLFDSTHMTIDVVTPNYDRVAEYAADAADIACFTGFNYGYLQTRARNAKTRVSVDGRAVRTVAIWKVHGSLDWFQDSAQQIFGVRSALKIPAALTPLMITPGIEKYRLTHGEPFTTVLACANAAVEKARAYFCVGYGFNDEHLQAKLQARCDWDSVPLVLITKELTPTARTILKSGQCRRYLAIEDGPAGARAYMHDVPDGFDLDKPLWQLDPFLDHMTGARA